MSVVRKLATATALASRGEWRLLARQARRHWRHRQLERAGGEPFVHRAAGHRLVCYPKLPDSVFHYVEGGDDRWELDLLRRWLQPGDAFLDAGANLGLYSHAVAETFRGEVTTLAVDASPDLVAVIDDTSRRLGHRATRAVHAAIGASEGEIPFFIARPGCSTVSQSMQVDEAGAGEYERRMVPQHTLGHLAREHLHGATVALIKLDIEGAEPLALRGAPASWMSADGPLWLIEINRPVLARMGFSASDIVDLIPESAFERWILPKFPLSGRPAAFPRRLTGYERFDDAHFHNLIALPRAAAHDSRRERVAALFR